MFLTPVITAGVFFWSTTIVFHKYFPPALAFISFRSTSRGYRLDQGYLDCFISKIKFLSKQLVPKIIPKNSISSS